jgi:hypothetical protein
MSSLLLMLLLFLTAARAEDALTLDVLEDDQWFVGRLNNEPLITMHVVVNRHGDGSRTSQNDTHLVIQRTMGETSIRVEMRRTAIFHETSAGNIVGFCFDEEQDGQRTSAIGRIEGRQIVATVHRLGRMQDQRVQIPDGTDLISDHASREQLLANPMVPGDKQPFCSLELFGGAVIITRGESVFKATEADGKLLFETTMDMLPVPMRMVLRPDGGLDSMSLNLGFAAIDLKPSDGPVPLLGAQLAPNGLVTAAGPAPSADAENRYRIPPEALAALGEDPFQSVDGDLLRVVSASAPTPIADRGAFLRPEPQVELDDPDLRAWVATITGDGQRDEADLAEQLRLAVRNHLTGDLTKGDASALEAFRDKRGDCTEHANLLCAALRIAGIPARTEVGLVFAAQYGGWTGHAWNSAYIGDCWVHLDSAYPGIPRSLYIKLGGMSVESGTTGLALITNLGRLAGKQIETVAPEETAAEDAVGVP